MRKHTRMVWAVMVMVVLSSSVEAAVYSGGAGTEADPYQIGTVANWTTLTATSGDWDKHFVLIADINFAGALLTPVAPDTGLGSWGFQGTAFTGVFDGNGHVLRNAQIHLPENDCVGLFGSIGEGGVIRNLGVEAVNVSGGESVGGLVGVNNDGIVTSCYATGTVSGDYYVGGLVGYSDFSFGTITLCYATGAVTGTGNFVGGLVGYNKGAVSWCYATGVVTGSEDSWGVGGLAGNSYQGTVTSCFWDKETTGQSGSSGGKGLTSSQMKTISYFQNANWNAYSWVMMAGDYPRLAWEGLGWPTIPAPETVPLTGTGTEADPYRITSAAEFALLSWHTSILDKYISLTADVDLSGVTLYPIGDLGPFTGVFDGDSHVLRNGVINLPGSDYVGLFGYLGEGGVIRNLGMEIFSITGRQSVGGLVGWYHNIGQITSCYVTGEVTGYEFVGGLVGFIYIGGTITSCYAAVAVTGADGLGGLVGMGSGTTVTSCYATGAVTGIYGPVGGLMGGTGGTVTSCYATGAVTGGSSVGGLVGENIGMVTSCYATGAVTGGSSVGGLVGWNRDTVASCYWNIETTGQNSSDGGEGRSTAEMTYPYAENTYVGWDFISVWAADVNHSVNNGYPYLLGNVPSPECIENPEDCVRPSNGIYVVGSELCLCVPCPLSSTSTFLWTKDDEPLINDMRISGANERTLQIISLETSDSGLYSCTYDNGAKVIQEYEVNVTVVAEVPALGPLGIIVLTTVCGALGVFKRRKRSEPDI